MAGSKITWEQFKVCNNDARGINFRFEDLCRQLFVNELLSENKKKCYLHSNPNNAGIESEPVYEEKSSRWVGYQAKFFETKTDYEQIYDSAVKTVRHYTGKVDHVYLFCNRAISVECDGYKKTVNLLAENNITIEPITDNVILDIVRKYSYLALYYFEQHSLNMEWFINHTEEIKSKLGERYNDELNVDTRASRYLSIFVRNIKSINYINDKKNSLLKEIEELKLGYHEYNEFLLKIEECVKSIEDINLDTFEDSLSWDGHLKNSLKEYIDELISQREGYETEIKDLYEIRQKEVNGTTSDKKQQEKETSSKEAVKNKLNNLSQKVRKIEDLIGLSSRLSINAIEREMFERKMLFVDGKAGAGKSHMLANLTVELLGENRYALLMVGGDYLDNAIIHEQIMKNLHLEYSFEVLLEILEGWGRENNCIIPILIDALNETWNISLWKNALPSIMDKINQLEYVRLVVSYRSEYKKLIIDDANILKYSVSELQHNGFRENSMEAAQKFLKYYNIPFTPSHFLDANITNPLFLTLYCKTYQGDDVGINVLYERVLEHANRNIHKTLNEQIRGIGYDETEDLVTPVINAISQLILQTGKKSFSLQEITELPIWSSYGLLSRPFIIQLVRENILHDYVVDEEKRLYFAYDQMNDFYCAKGIIFQYKTKESIKEYLLQDVLGIYEGKISKYGNRDLFINACVLYAEKFKEECIDILDDIDDEDDRRFLFEGYIESLQWRKCDTIDVETLFALIRKYEPEIEKVLEMFIVNSVKKEHPLNVETLHDLLMNYSLNERDYIWTTYINGIDDNSNNRLVQLMIEYSRGNHLEEIDKNQIMLLLILSSWCLTSSNRWFRDTVSKAMIEILKKDFKLCQALLEKFEEVNDPYVIQRLYGIVFGACVKRIEKQGKETYKSLVDYVYNSIFNRDLVYADILLRDYCRLIIERFFYEYPEERNNYDYKRIIPPYKSEIIPNIDNQVYLEEKLSGGTYRIVSSMKFEGMGMYGDFGRYVFQSALRNFDVNDSEIFNYSLSYIFNNLGYKEELFGEYDTSLGAYNYNRHNTAKTERIGKKYQWITMYNILARVSDQFKMVDRYSSEETDIKFEGAWEPFLRDFDPTLNECFMSNLDAPTFESVQMHKEVAEKENVIVGSSEVWLNEMDSFFEYQKTDLLLNGNDNKEWVVLTKYSDVGRENLATNKLEKWIWLYGYFVTEEQKIILQKYSNARINLLNEDIRWMPEIYTIFVREYPWSPSCKKFIEYSRKSGEIRTGEKRTITETYEIPVFSPIEKLLKQYGINENEEDVDSGITKIEFSMEKQTVSRQVDVTEDIGNILSATATLRWESEYDASKEETISYSVPCANVIETLGLSQQEKDGYFYNKDGILVAFDSSLMNQNAGIIIRKDFLDEFLRQTNMYLVWFVNAAKEIHSNDLSIEQWSDWTGLLSYDGSSVNGEIFRTEYQE